FKAAEKGLELLNYLDQGIPPFFQGDPNRLRQILINLLSNAIKFTEKGEVSLFVTLEGSGVQELGIRFSIRDTGIGISREQQARIFSPFAHADNSVSRRFGGTGLGLSISKHLAELMGGEIGVESTEGEGSTFWVTIALQRGTSSYPKLLPAEIKGKRALVVD